MSDILLRANRYALSDQGRRTAHLARRVAVLVPPRPLLAATGLGMGSADRILAFFSLRDGYGNPENDMQAIYQTLRRFLESDGVFVVLDNSSTPGSGLASVPTLHRIDETYLRDEIVKAGFELVGESDVVRKPDDDLDSSWFKDTETREAGCRDRFALLFRKAD